MISGSHGFLESLFRGCSVNGFVVVIALFVSKFLPIRKKGNMKSERVAYPIFGASGLVNLCASLAIPAILCRKTDHNLQIKIHRAHGFKFLILLNHRP